MTRVRKKWLNNGWKFQVYTMKKRNLILLALLCILVLAFMVAPVAAEGLTITDGEKIISPYGAMSSVITIADSDIPGGGTITIDVLNLYLFVNSGTFTDANVVITSDAAAATWTGVVSGDGGVNQIITLTSTGGNTTVGENITVTFTGAGGNPWLPGSIDTYGINLSIPLTVTRIDTSQAATMNFMIETPTPPPGGLTVTDGPKITSSDGATSPVITIADADIPQNGTITINVPDLNLFVNNGTFTDANLVINDTAAAATWTRSVSGTGNLITLTSTGGPTVIGENVTITFTGAGGNPWLPNTSSLYGDVVMPLTVTRTDTFQTAILNFLIETVPPVGPIPVTNFSASKRADIAPLTVTFTDTSLRNPTSWSWDFGDGAISASRDPIHTYSNVGTFTVNLTATNVYGSDTRTQWNYIHVLNGAIREANTSITGLTINNCGSPQTVTVDTSVLPAALIPNTSVLGLQPPADRGLKTVTFYALNGIGFSRNGNVITGNPTGVHLVTEEIAPSPGFSGRIGTKSSFNYSMDLPSYPCNAVLTTKIWEGVISEYDNKFRQIADGNGASVVGTAYTAKITKTNFPSAAPAKVHLSVNSSWNSNLSGGPGKIFIWRITDDGNSGQILPTTYLYSNPVDNLDYFEADSPLGLSTFGISSLTGNNNPFQIITFVIAEIISPNKGVNPYTGGEQNKPIVVQTTITPEINTSIAPDPGKTAKIYSNAQGVITQATTLKSTDGLANISLGLGIVARNSSGNPLSSVSIRRIPAENLPAGSPGAALSFAGIAYELQPDGATFSPSIPVSFTIPQAQWGHEYAIQEYDNVTGTWQPLPYNYDPQTGKISAKVSHFCCFALFTKSTTIEKAESPKPTITIIVASKSSMSTNVEMYSWIISSVKQNPVIIVIVLAILALVAYFRWWKRRL